MSDNAIAGVGTQFFRWNASATPNAAWEEIAEVNQISWTGMSRETFETTDLSTTGGYKTFKPSFRDPGSLNLDMNFERTTYDLMKADFESDDLKHYEIVLPDDDNTSFELTGFVTEIPITIPGQKVTANTVIKISGQVTVNSGSGPSPG